jgi:hypothetical protein
MIPMTFATRPKVRQIPSAGIAWSSLLDHLIRAFKLGLRSIDLAMALPGRASSTFSHEPYAEGKGVARVWALAESILEMVNLALASGRERVVTQQGLHDAGVVVAASKQYGSAHVANHRLPLHIATHAHRRSARISDDYLLIQLPDERRLDGEFFAACES